jgi:plastocyanin
MKPLKLFSLCAVLVLALAFGQVAPASSSAPASASAANRVTMRGFAFHPGTLRVPKGARVVFTNSDRVSHTATDRGVFDTGVIKPGHAATVRFKRRGVFRYVCRIHPFMHGKIVVG